VKIKKELTPEELAERRRFFLARSVRDMTQEDLAKKAKINRSTYALFESGQIDLAPDQLSRVVAVIDRATKAAQKVPKGKLQGRVLYVARRDRRLTAGLSQHELARKAQLSQTKISGWETGRVELSAEEKTRWDDALRSLDGNKSGVALARLSNLGVNDLRETREAIAAQFGSIENWEEIKKMGQQMLRQEKQIAALRDQVAALEEQNKALMQEWTERTKNKVN
jgi:transcriptional regulator with XRE-family HTH domain